MKEWTLQLVIKHFDYFVKTVDFDQLPAKESEEYRQLLLKTASDVIFSEGRYSNITEYLLELFDVPEVLSLVHNLTAIHALSDSQRKRLNFYLDLAKVCYPLFRGKKVDWTQWPWQMQNASNSLDNSDLFEMIANGPYANLSAAMLYDLKEQIWNDEEFYSSVARQEVSELFEYSVKHLWEKHPKSDEETKQLATAINETANKLWFVENHIHVGRQLGFDHLAQSVYDAFDTFIDNTYRHQQVSFAREFAAWIRENMTVGERHPDTKIVHALDLKMQELMAKYKVESPDLNFSWNILTLDVLGMSMFSDEEENDPDPWGMNDIDEP